MAPRVCPDCDELMDTAYEDGVGDYGDDIEEVLTCPECGYKLRRILGSSTYRDGYSYVTFEEGED